MSFLVAYPGTGEFAQQVALGLDEVGLLEAFATTFGVRSDDVLLRLLRGVPGPLSTRLQRNLLRRNLDLVPAAKIHRHMGLELARTASAQCGLGPHLTDAIWDLMSHDFTRHLARWVRRRRPYALYAYEYTAEEAFTAARQSGTVRILDLPSLSSRGLEELLRQEVARFPDLQVAQDGYFRRRFARRQARRDAEIGQADLIVCNSQVTRQSHMDQGADGSRMIVVPLAAPPAIDAPCERDASEPLRLVWAGTFSLRKGAHYLLAACREPAPKAVVIEVFGSMALPPAALRALPDIFKFHGSIARQQLLTQFEQADALVFPTLSDGFGMVVTEALSRGLPVITTARAGAAELIRHQENGLIIPAQDAAALRQAIQWCLDNRARLNAMRGAALATAKARQWPQYRRELVMALKRGLVSRGFSWPAEPAASYENLRQSVA